VAIPQQRGEPIVIGKAVVDENGEIAGHLEMEAFEAAAEKSLGHFYFAIALPKSLLRRIVRQWYHPHSGGRHEKSKGEVMEDASEATATKAFLHYRNKTTGAVVLALELTEATIEIMRHTPGLEELATKTHPGDFSVGFEMQVISHDEFLEQYSLIGQGLPA